MTEKPTIHTHLFIGGPKDGERQETKNTKYCLYAIDKNFKLLEFQYVQTVLETETTRFIFWQLENEDPNTIIEKLISHY